MKQRQLINLRPSSSMSPPASPAIMPAIPPNTGALFKAGLLYVSTSNQTLNCGYARNKCSLSFDEVHVYSNLWDISKYQASSYHSDSP